MSLTPYTGSAPNSVTRPTTFDTDSDAYLAWFVSTFFPELNTLVGGLNAIAAGTAAAIPYTFSTTTTDSDPGAGALRLDNATQASATTIRADLVGSDGVTYTDVLALLDDSTSVVKGFIQIENIADPTKWLIFTVASLASPAGYKNITVACVASSGANPLVNGDTVVLKFTRTGDAGDTGDTTLVVDISGSTAAVFALSAGYHQRYTPTADFTISFNWGATTAMGTLAARITNGGNFTGTWPSSALAVTWPVASGHTTAVASNGIILHSADSNYFSFEGTAAAALVGFGR